jgi:hypothetical protein
LLAIVNASKTYLEVSTKPGQVHTKEEARQGARLFRHALRRNSTSTSSSGSTQFDFSNELERDFGAKCGFYMMVPFRHRVQGL